MNIGIVGLGLIGGSFAKAFQKTEHTVYGWDLAADIVQYACMVGDIDGVLDAEQLKRCDCVLICLYPQLCVDYVREHANDFKDNALIVDCAGVKRTVCESLFELNRNYTWHFIGGHPMAGNEFSGYAHAENSLYENASMILTPPKGIEIEILEAAKALFMELGFKMVRITSPEEHDSMIAYTSQIAHIVSSAYIKNPMSQKHKGFSAGSFKGMTRVARLNETMWTELFLDNDDLLLPALDDLLMRLTEYRNALAARDVEQLKKLLREGRLMKEALD